MTIPIWLIVAIVYLGVGLMLYFVLRVLEDAMGLAWGFVQALGGPKMGKPSGIQRVKEFFGVVLFWLPVILWCVVRGK